MCTSPRSGSRQRGHRILWGTTRGMSLEVIYPQIISFQSQPALEMPNNKAGLVYSLSRQENKPLSTWECLDLTKFITVAYRSPIPVRQTGQGLASQKTQLCAVFKWSFSTLSRLFLEFNFLSTANWGTTGKSQIFNWEMSAWDEWPP